MPTSHGARRWLIVALGIALGLVTAEIGIRLVDPYRTPTAERVRSWRYQAGVLARAVFPQMEQERVEPPQRITAQGYRGRTFALPKPAGVRRVVVLGGSSAFDIDAVEGADWPSLLEARLRATGHTDVEVINAGTPGNATWDLLGRLTGEIWMFEPDVIVLYEAWNDMKAWQRIAPERSLLRTQTPARYVGAQHAVLVWNPFLEYANPVDRLACRSQVYLALRTFWYRWKSGLFGGERRLSADPPSDTFSPWGPRQYELDLHLLVAATRAAGAAPLLTTQARLVVPDNDDEARRRIGYSLVGLSHAAILEGYAACDAAARRVAASERVPLLDLAALNGRQELFRDHVHTTAAGSAALADAVAGAVGPLLGRGTP